MAANGRLPDSELVTVQYGLRLPKPAARQWAAFKEAARSRYSRDFRLTYSSTWPAPPTEIGGLGAYRTIECQRWMYLHRNDGGKKRRCAAPGNSVHGTTPGCIDIYNHADLPRKTLEALAREFGWIPNTVPGEPWHFKYDGTTVAGGDYEAFPAEEDKKEEDDDMGAVTIHVVPQDAAKTVFKRYRSSELTHYEISLDQANAESRGGARVVEVSEPDRKLIAQGAVGGWRRIVNLTAAATLTALKESGAASADVTPEQIQRAAEAAVRNVLGGLDG